MENTETKIQFDSAYYKLLSDIRNQEHEISLRKKQIIEFKKELSEKIFRLNKFDTGNITSNN